MLRQVAFPAFTLASLKSKDIGINLPTVGTGGVVGGKAGGSSVSDSTVSIKIPAAESYSVPLVNLLENWPRSESDATCLKWKQALNILGIDANSKEAEFILISDVYYARAIDVDIASENQNAFVAGLTSTTLSTLSDSLNSLEKNLTLLVPSKADISAAGGVAPAESSDPLDGTKRITAKQAKDTIDAIKTTVAGLTPAGAGINTSIVSSTGSTITMRSAFQRPVAIGYRSIHFKMNQTSCQISKVAVGAGPELVPTMMAAPPPRQ